ncbi:LacI family DNA-binding transcriptional regulator [Streptomyces sp. NPDC047002]|uniref:LacI family DNA-binding transcriptional regulator n=1 Tax=Streptomyces sp. NPDC047002 TaxID=3155475 RepID=UPI003451CA25
MRDVARVAGVSTATVVRVVKGDARVSPSTRASVQAVIEQLGYVPNAAARALTSGRSRMLGLLVPNIQNPFNSSVAESMQHALLAHGYHLVISSVAGDGDPRRHLVSAAADGTLAGIAMTSVRPDIDLLRLVSRRLAAVFIDQRPGIDGVDIVRTNNREVTFDAVSELIRAGHRRIALVGGPEAFDTARERRTGYADALTASGIAFDPGLVVEGASDERGGKAATAVVLGRSEPPTAVFAYNGRVAIGVLEATRAAGLHVPDDLSLVAFDDDPAFEVTDPPVTAVRQPTQHMGALAAELLVRQLDDPEHTRGEHVAPSQLVRRNSVGPPRSAG